MKIVVQVTKKTEYASTSNRFYTLTQLGKKGADALIEADGRNGQLTISIRNADLDELELGRAYDLTLTPSGNDD